MSFSLELNSPTNMGGRYSVQTMVRILPDNLMGVDSFDQPGLEEGKVLARPFLAQA